MFWAKPAMWLLQIITARCDVISRADQDTFALRSQHCSPATQRGGFFREKSSPLPHLGNMTALPTLYMCHAPYFMSSTCGFTRSKCRRLPLCYGRRLRPATTAGWLIRLKKSDRWARSVRHQTRCEPWVRCRWNLLPRVVICLIFPIRDPVHEPPIHRSFHHALQRCGQRSPVPAP